MFTILGIDIGSVAISLALIDEDKRVVSSGYKFHHGKIPQNLLELLETFDLTNLGGIAVTSSTPEIIKGAYPYDSQLSIISAVKHFYKDVGSILFIGAENFGLIKFNSKGEYESLRSNSSCAAGTGSFLDQQAARLNLSDSNALGNIALKSDNISPKIATRCAVFAKTDLIHAQQEGYSIGQISDGLCEGLVKNVIDTVMPDVSNINTPLIFSGGVSMNDAVAKHLSTMIKVKPVIGKFSRLYGAIGTALLYLEERKLKKIEVPNPESLIIVLQKKKEYGYDPLELKLSKYPDFLSEKSSVYTTKSSGIKVEFDIYKEIKRSQEVFLGIDIGSTSTKAVLIDEQVAILAGFYTRTSGQPIKAVQAIFETIKKVSKESGFTFKICGVGTTGSGRKFIGKIINADLIVDEITAHARAAYELNRDVDTIIEIGGQDSKFTTMKSGMVTFSVMNNICAAGTGSFIEEQALKLDCPLEEFSERAMYSPAPLSSDRCTVFMERDINHYLVNGYSTEEVLASVLHSIRDNYLMKVAVEADIGENICFQGATGKNKALIAAFEQKLKKPIFVSKYCHLTGALGSALIVLEDGNKKSRFRGLDLYKKEIPFESEICTLCHNNCKITKVKVQNEIVAFGFLCGRDYDTKKFVSKKREVFNLLTVRNDAEKFSPFISKLKKSVRIGIPEALYLKEESMIWKIFFDRLGVQTVTSDTLAETVRYGKRICGAEYCAPMYSFFGHIKDLADRCDYVFLPAYFENRERKKDGNLQYCYYSQYAPSLATSIKSLGLEDRVIMPMVDSRYFNIITELFTLLNPIIHCTYWSIHSAYQGALDKYRESRVRLRSVFLREFESSNDINVLLIGRPYSILDPLMNKGIPDIFTSMKIKVFFQDMLTYSAEDVEEVNPLLKALHWNYASKIIESSIIAAKTENLYPVLVTSFKCAPDSFVIEYFKRIMERYRKPYLILQLDEHDSSIGYDTRIEAAVRSFRNHASRREDRKLKVNSLPLNPKVISNIEGKTLLFPCWDHLTSKLLEAVLVSEGIDARMVPLTDKAIQVGPKTNTGMCLPVNIITQSYIDFIEESCLNPDETAVWMFEAIIACNIKMFPYFMKSTFESYGRGLEKVSVYTGKLSFKDISYQATLEAYFAHMFGGMLRRIGCKIRPYEKEKGKTDKVICQSLSLLYNTFLGNRNKEDDIIRVVDMFKKIELEKVDRPKVAILGDFYVRDNDVMNQGLEHFIEKYGGEVITTPFSDMAKLMTEPFFRRSMKLRTFRDAITTKAMMTLVTALEKNYNKHFNELLKESDKEWFVDYKKIFKMFNLKLGHYGESVDNLLTIFYLIKRYPDLSLIVQVNPAFCCAGLVSQSLSEKIEEVIGIPMVILNYDGTNKGQNEKLIPYLKFLKK